MVNKVGGNEWVVECGGKYGGKCWWKYWFKHWW